MDLQRRNNKYNKKAAVQDGTKNGIDFVKDLPKDLVFTIFSYLDDVADIHRAKSVSRLWQLYVLINANHLYQNLCFRKAPGMSSISFLLGRFDTYEMRSGPERIDFVEGTHKVYSSLLRALSISMKYPRDCLQCVLGSSSTNRHPEQSIVHILRPEAKYLSHDTYWSSRGVSDSKTNESILLELDSCFCIVTEIDIHPYKALLEPGSPVYSPRFVRFQMGYPKFKQYENVYLKNLPWLELDDNKYVWTYTSQEFPVIQDDSLQQFKLQEPLICVGGILKIELLGRAQRNEQDGMYYTCINHVKILGHPLSPAFEVTLNSHDSELCFVYSPDQFDRVLRRISPPEEEQNVVEYNTVAAFQVRRLMELLFPGQWVDPWEDFMDSGDDSEDSGDDSEDSGDDLDAMWNPWDLL